VKTIYHQIEIVDENCTGCYRCERVCPTSAIVMVSRTNESEKRPALAVVDNDQCIACFRCIDACDDDAMLPVERDEPLVLDGAAEGVDPEAVRALCQATGMYPDAMMCQCSGSQAKELAAAVIGGATTFEEVAWKTGAQAGCLMYCSVPIRRLLRAHTGEVRTGSKVRRYPAEFGLMDVPEEVARRYPLFNVLQEQQLRREFVETMDIDL
jgi:ferredoxin